MIERNLGMRCFVMRYIVYFSSAVFPLPENPKQLKKYYLILVHVGMFKIRFHVIFLFEAVNLPIFPKDCPRTKDLIAIWSAILTSGLLDLGMEAEMNI